MTGVVEQLLAKLDMAQPRIAWRDMYYRGKQPLRFMVDQVDQSLSGINVNVCRVAVNAVAERIRLKDVKASVRGKDISQEARRLIQDADLPMLLESVVADMLAVGSAYLVVWTDEFNRPVITGESAEQVAISRHPVTGSVTAAIKHWYVVDANGVETDEFVVKYLPSEIVTLRKNREHGQWRLFDRVPNPLGVVPVVPLINIDRIGSDTGASVVDDLAPLVDALNKLISDMLTASEMSSRPARWATGIALSDSAEEASVGFNADDPVAPDVPPVDKFTAAGVDNPFPDDVKMLVAESEQAKFGQLPGADLKGYGTALDALIQQIMMVSALPSHMMGITTSNPATAEALRASEVALASRAQSRIRVINRPMEWAVRLLLAVDLGVKPQEISVSLEWADPTTRSIAQVADAVVKAHAEGITNTEEARAEIEQKETL